jgi:palmitoyl-[glycerolipid] 3-(E)-desaturase
VISHNLAADCPLPTRKIEPRKKSTTMRIAIAGLLAATAVQAFSPSSSFVGRTATTTLQAATVVDETMEDTKKATAKSYLDDGFVFGMDGSGLERPKGKEALVVVDGDDLETKDWQVAVVSATFLGHAAFAATAVNEMLQVNGGDVGLTAAQAMSLVAASWVLADFGSGVLHWSVDNYGNGRTPVMGSIIAAFQGHHTAPWTITQRGFCNNVYKLCVPFGVATMGAISFLTGPHATLFFTVFCVMEILSQELHKWSHMTKKEVPRWVNFLQDTGLTIGRKPHAQHHMAPYDGNYCIISGICNPWLDQSGFFRRLEHMVYNLNGVESNAWKLDPELKERTLRGEYALPETN